MMKTRSIIVAGFMIAIISMICIISPKLSYANSVDAQSHKGGIIFNGKTINNENLYYPMIKIGNTIYYPVSNLDLPLIGLKIDSTHEGESIRLIDYSGNRTKPSERAKDSIVKANVVDNHILYQDKMLKDSKATNITCLDIVYMPLTASTLKTMGYFSEENEKLGLVIDSRSSEKLKVFIDSSVDQEELLLAKYIIKVNGSINQKTAEKYVDLVSRSADKYKIDRVWLMAIIWQESRFNEKSKGAGAYGMMQMMEATGRIMGCSKEELLDAETSIDKGTAYLRLMIDRFDGDVKKGIIAYNQGERNVSRGNYSKWYLEDVGEKYNKIKAYISTNIK